MALSGPTGMGMVKLMDAAENGETQDQYNITIAGAADEINGKLITGEVDIAALPCNVASVLYNKTEGEVQVAAINTLGVLYILEKGDDIHSVADLAGKTIISTGKANTPEYVLNYLLNANGLDPEKDVTIEYKTEAAEIASAFQQGQAEIAMVPQPVATTILAKNEDVRTALDVTEESTEAREKIRINWLLALLLFARQFLMSIPKRLSVSWPCTVTPLITSTTMSKRAQLWSKNMVLSLQPRLRKKPFRSAILCTWTAKT